eukprot:m51a1_g14652 putative protein serine threonine (1032) ;mRNA; f:110388-114236
MSSRDSARTLAIALALCVSAAGAFGTDTFSFMYPMLPAGCTTSGPVKMQHPVYADWRVGVDLALFGSLRVCLGNSTRECAVVHLNTTSVDFAGARAAVSGTWPASRTPIVIAYPWGGDLTVRAGQRTLAVVPSPSGGVPTVTRVSVSGDLTLYAITAWAPQYADCSVSPCCDIRGCAECVSGVGCTKCREKWTSGTACDCAAGYTRASAYEDCSPVCTSSACVGCVSPNVCSSCNKTGFDPRKGCTACQLGFTYVAATNTCSQNPDDNVAEMLYHCHQQSSLSGCLRTPHCSWCNTTAACLLPQVPGETCPACAQLSRPQCSGACAWCAVEGTCKAPAAACPDSCALLDVGACSAAAGCMWCTLGNGSCLSAADFARTCDVDCWSHTNASCPANGLCSPCGERCIDAYLECSECNAAHNSTTPAGCASNSSSSSSCAWCEEAEHCSSSLETCVQCKDALFESRCGLGIYRRCSWCQASATCVKSAGPACSCASIERKANCSASPGCAWCASTAACGAAGAECVLCESIADESLCAAHLGCGWSQPLQFCTSSVTVVPLRCAIISDEALCARFGSCSWCGGECRAGECAGGQQLDTKWIIVIPVGSAVVVAALCGAVASVVYLRSRPSRGRRASMASRAPVVFGALGAASETSAGDPRFGLRLSVERLVFGSPTLIEVEDARSLVLHVTNATERDCTVTAFAPPDSDKATVALVPENTRLRLAPGETFDLTVTAVAHCTTVARTAVAVCRDGETYVRVPVEVRSSESTRLDWDELQFGETIGEGAYGVVMTGTWRTTRVAIKEMRTMFVDTEIEAQFLREIDIMNRVRSPYVVSFIGTARRDSTRAIVMEYVPLGSLETLLEREPLALALKIKIAHDCTQGMLVLHSNGILHRDLKPGNILMLSLNPRDSVCAKLSDFGSSREVGDDRARQYTKGVGTCIYMAPEVLIGEPYSSKCDVYSFGIVLYELVTQTRPYSEFENNFALIRYVTDGGRMQLPDNSPLSKIAKACWSQDPESRPEFCTIVHMVLPLMS